MSVLIAVILFAGSMINALLAGFSTLNIIYIVLAALLMVISFVLSKHAVMKKSYIMIVVYIVFAILILLSSKIFAVQSQFVFSAELNKAGSLLQAGNYKQAEKLLDKLYKIDQSDPYVNLNLAVVYLKQHNTDKVRQHLDTASQKLYFDENLWYDYGLLFYQLKDYRNALANFEKAVKLNPDMVNAHIYAGTMSYWLKDMRRSIYHLENAEFLKPDSPEIFFHLGRSHIELMQYKEAEDAFNNALKLKPPKELEQSIKEQLAKVASLKGGAEG